MALSFLVLVSPLALAMLNKGLGPPPPTVDRTNPLSVVQGFLESAHQGNYASAAHYLSVDHLAPQDQATLGPRLARRLRFVVDRELGLDLSTITRNPEGQPEGTRVLELGVIAVGKVKYPIRLARVSQAEGDDIWLFDRSTVRAIDGLFTVVGPPLGDAIPEVLTRRTAFGLEGWQWIGLLGLLFLAAVLARSLEALVLATGRQLTPYTHLHWDQAAVDSGQGSLRILLFGLAMFAASRVLLLPPAAAATVELVARSITIVSVGWFLTRFIDAFAMHLETTVRSEKDPARMRSVQTQVAVLRRVVLVGVWLIAGALLLMQFRAVRTLGVSLLASAGVAGLVIGLAAQKSIGALLAGIQLSVTQPIRIGDNVTVENEYGTIEEIRLTYVVVHLWDSRRLIVPMNYFLEKPFLNWSKNVTGLQGTVSMHVDFTADVAAIRTEVAKAMLTPEIAALWDGNTASVQVTEASDRTQTLRVLVSAADQSKLFDLRCLLREKLIGIVRAHPKWLPTQRTFPAPQDNLR
ncbi:MAG: mechanosensitive ion channel family protein [Myxococcaceae bacterium]